MDVPSTVRQVASPVLRFRFPRRLREAAASLLHSTMAEPHCIARCAGIKDCVRVLFNAMSPDKYGEPEFVSLFFLLFKQLDPDQQECLKPIQFAVQHDLETIAKLVPSNTDDINSVVRCCSTYFLDRGCQLPFIGSTLHLASFKGAMSMA